MPQIEEGVESVQEPLEEESSELNPEPAGEESTEEQGADGAESTEKGSEEEAESTESNDGNWLPDEQAKEFPLQVMAEFAQKRNYGWSAEDIAADPGKQRILKDKLNADIEVRRLRGMLEPEEEETDDDAEPLGLAEDEEEAITGVQPKAAATTPATPEAIQAAHYQRVESFVSKLDPKKIEDLGRELLGAFGVDVDPKRVQQLQTMLQDPNLTAESRADVQQSLALAQNVGKIGGTLSRALADGMMTLGPQLAGEWIEKVFPGTMERYQKGVAEDVWNSLSSRAGKDSKPIYPGLPKFGSQEYRKLVTRVEKQMGINLGNLANSLSNEDGSPMSLQERFGKVMRVVAKAAKGQQVTPAIVQQALKTGAKKATQAAERSARGRAIGAGQPTGPKATRDSFRQAIDKYNASQKST